MKKGWKYRLLSGVSAMLLAGAIPMAAYADEENTVQEQAQGQQKKIRRLPWRLLLISILQEVCLPVIR